MNKISNSSTIKQISLVAIFFVCAAFLLPSANAVGKWEKDLDGNTTQDYYRPVNVSFLNLVNHYHMRPKEKLHDQSTTTYNVGDIVYTLTFLPNHPLALRRATLTCTEHPDLYKCSDVEKRFKKAVAWDPRQPNTRVLYGMFLQLTEQEDEAIKQYLLALSLKPGMLDAHYNMALIYYEREDWKKATEHAKSAYANGHRAPGLRRKLNEKGLM